MKMKNIFIICIISVLFMTLFIKNAAASEKGLSYFFEPLYRHSIVSGDREKFREDMWIKDRAAGGLNEFELSSDSKDMKLDVEGRAIVDENDYLFDVNLEKENLFELSAGFKEFTKYYDGTGGFYSRFNTLRSIELEKELELRDGHFFIDLTYNKPDSPVYFIGYERHAKTGAISGLDWNSTVEFGTTRKTAPAYKEIDEVLHTIKFGGETDTNLLNKEIHLRAEQKFLYFNEESKRVERKFGATAAQNAIDTQEERPESHSYMTTLLADSRINNWLYISSATEYEHVHASVLEDLTERNSTTGVITNFATSTENFFNSTASNNLDKYTWTTSLYLDPFKYLATTAKVKAELKKRNSDSVYPRDTTAIADFRIDNISVSDTSSDYKSLAENLSVRFTKLPRTVLYVDGEFEQIDGRIKEERINWTNASETFSRDTDIIYYRNNITTGINWYPCNLLSISSQFRKVLNKDNYSDREETRGTNTAAFSAFIDEQQFQGDNFTTKINIKPYKWIHGMLKYQLRNSNIYTRVESQGSAKAVHDVNTYLGTVTVIPSANFYITGMFSKQTAFTDTVARLAIDPVIPTYEADVNTAMGSATYIITPKASLEAQYQWIRADDFKDFSRTGLPYGLDNVIHRVWMSFRYNLKENLLTEMNYGFSKYDENSNQDVDNYNGHIIASKVKFIF